MIKIESKENTLFKEFKKLKEKKYRQQKQSYIVEGFRFVEEAIRSSANIEYIVIDEKVLDKAEELLNENNIKSIKVIVLASSLFNQLIFTETPQGIIAITKMKDFSLSEGEIFVLVDKVQDPGNMGTIIRTAHAVNAAGIILTKGTVDVYNDKTLRSTMGSIFYMPIIVDNDLSLIKKLKEKNYKLIVSSLQGKNNFFEEDLSGNIIIAVGNEGSGVSKEIEDLADIKVRIPMPGNAESLNVAVATSIMLYEKIRQNLIK
ncbi:RNA methyltransferase, TrmH family [Clostridium cavendishii DSM 21758]|uniref:RNA methyltransferase, TrmH family n=1 Tax=Clostridium cavendishii DSM 21758 TaxID=1121302 RepID=A0A1M6KUC4_9CLOT|nr:RNA methyltransferase [Clostridium cavendishii]SHJ62470.1 RNA methyltransferase, TrmH family [Clostridium cavendishii DSM 21758]